MTCSLWRLLRVDFLHESCKCGMSYLPIFLPRGIQRPCFSASEMMQQRMFGSVSRHTCAGFLITGICLEAQFEGIFPLTSSSSEVANSHPGVYTHPRIALTHDRPQCSRAMSEVWRPLNSSTPCVNTKALFFWGVSGRKHRVYSWCVAVCGFSSLTAHFPIDWVTVTHLWH